MPTISKVTSFLLVLSLVLVLLAPGILSRVAAQGSSPFHLSATITAVGQDSEFRFVPNFIPAGRGVIVNVTFVNNHTIGHSFTIRDEAGAGTFVVDTTVISGGTMAQVEFMVNDTGMINLISGGVVAPDSIQVETLDLQGVGSGIKFFCIPHEGLSLPMVGVILIAGTGVGQVGPVYPGFALWAFWIGVIAILAMIGFIGVTYGIIKGSSSRNVDHREHVRRGLP